MREKLIKALDKTGICNAEYCCDCEFNKDVEGCVRRQKEIIADSLIANDVVPVVRCKDCKHFEYGCQCYHPLGATLGNHGFLLVDGEDDFCSNGERRERE